MYIFPGFSPAPRLVYFSLAFAPGPVAAEADGSISRDCRDDARRVNLADASVITIGNVQITGGVHRDPSWGSQTRVCRQAPVPAEAVRSISRDRGDDAGGNNLADA